MHLDNAWYIGTPQEMLAMTIAINFEFDEETIYFKNRFPFYCPSQL